MTDAEIAGAIRDLAHKRGRGKSFCPSEAARALSPEWRALMPDIRRVAADLPDIQATQKGAEVDPQTAKGPIRLGLKA
ncbi:MAG: DUF3253 domain-containing protein [Pseudomonadota bacterium]